MDVYTAKGTPMKRLAALLLPLALAAALPATAASPDKGPATIAAALEQGARQHKPVLIDFQAVWCYSCYFMASHVLNGDEFKALESKVIFVEADADAPDGQAWMNPLVRGASTVTFNTTAVAPVGGTPPNPATFNSVSACELSAEMLPPSPVRVSSSRAGFSGT